MIVLVLAGAQTMQGTALSGTVTMADKKAFLDLVSTLPREEGGMFTKEAGREIAPFARIFVSLTPKDVDPYWEVHLAYLVGPLLDDRESREFCIRNFAKIAHPTLRMWCGLLAFKKGYATKDVLNYLVNASSTKEGRELMEDIMGDDADGFIAQVKARSVEKK